MEMQCETLNLFLDLSTHLVFSAKLLFPRSCQMTSGHKRKEVASVSVLPEAEPPNGRNIQARGHPSSPPLPPLVP